MPASGCSRPATRRSRVLLPQPPGPHQDREGPLRDLDVDAFQHRRAAERLRDAADGASQRRGGTTMGCLRRDVRADRRRGRVGCPRLGHDGFLRVESCALGGAGRIVASDVSDAGVTYHGSEARAPIFSAPGDRDHRRTGREGTLPRGDVGIVFYVTSALGSARVEVVASAFGERLRIGRTGVDLLEPREERGMGRCLQSRALLRQLRGEAHLHVGGGELRAPRTPGPWRCIAPCSRGASGAAAR